MKNFFNSLIMILITCAILFCSSCSFSLPQHCSKHTGEMICQKCGLNYFEEFSSVIKVRANTIENGKYIVEANTENVDCAISYNESENEISCSLTYKNDSVPIAVFLLTMKPNTGTSYGWTLASVGKTTSNTFGTLKIAQGIFKAEDVKELVYRPPIDTTEFSEQEFTPFVSYYETSISFCVDTIYSLLIDNENNLTISDLGFCNYIPNV